MAGVCLKLVLKVSIFALMCWNVIYVLFRSGSQTFKNVFLCVTFARLSGAASAARSRLQESKESFSGGSGGGNLMIGNGDNAASMSER